MSGPDAERFASLSLSCVLRCSRQAAANQRHQKPHTGAAMKTTGVPLISWKNRPIHYSSNRRVPGEQWRIEHAPAGVTRFDRNVMVGDIRGTIFLHSEAA